MVWVKVCGVGTAADVAAAQDAGADAIGLTLAASPRQISPEHARNLAKHASCETIIVTVDARPSEILDLAMFVGCSGVQLHGAHASEAGAAARKAGLDVYRHAPVGASVDLSVIPPDQKPLLDTGSTVLHGGTGRPFDWSLATTIEREFVLAGGLGPENVAEAVTLVRPWGVDASSRLESAPGVKDHALITRYVQEAKRS
jgi:phosphoribosylanthranilate isomerase